MSPSLATTAEPAVLTFPCAPGTMAALVRDHRWSATPLGPIAAWPTSLRIAVEMVLASQFPKCLVWGPELTCIYNDAFRVILGDKPEALGRGFDAVWQEAWSAIGPLVRRAQAGEAVFIEDYPLVIDRHGYEEQTYFTFCYSPVRDEHGKVVGIVDTVMETTTKFLAQHKLAELANSLEQQVAERTADRDRMWRLSTDVLMVADMDGGILATNPSWTTVLGWQPEELAGRSFLDFVHPDDRHLTTANLAAMAAGSTTVRCENRCLRRDGGYNTVAWTASPEGGRVLASGRDVTEERTAAEALRRTEAALHQAQKMESVGQLTGGVAHDFNNLLQVISGNLQLLARSLAGDGRSERHVRNALAGVQRGAKLASQLLAFARRQPLAPRVVNIGRFVNGMDDMLRSSLGEAVEIETVVSGGLWNCAVDPAQMENAVLNLAINARDAMNGVGRLTIEAGNVRLDDDYVQGHPDLEPGQYVMLAVSDTGSGMPPEVLARVFEPFFSTKGEGKGTGLGLSMVYGFVKQSGGHVRVYSEPGHGTSVKLYLPRAEGEETAEAQQAHGPTEGGSETILVAEDDEQVRGTVVELLAALGYKVLTARDASAALAIVESGVHIDLLFTDVVMPGELRSPELARRARERLPGIAVLFTSGYTQNAIVHGGKLDEGVELLGKPYSQDALARKVRAVLERTRTALQLRTSNPLLPS